MSAGLMSAIWHDEAYRRFKRNHLLVLLALADEAGQDDVCHTSRDRLSRKCRVSRKVLEGVLVDLQAGGVLSIVDDLFENYDVCFRIHAGREASE